MLVQTKWDIGDVVFSPLDARSVIVQGIKVTNNRGNMQEWYQLDQDFVWYPLEELLGVNDGKQI